MDRESTARRNGGGTVVSLAALGGGIAIGAVLHGRSGAALAGLDAVVAIVGGIWLNALKMIVLPLVITQLLVAITSGRGGRLVGRLGVGAVALFVSLHLLAAVYTVFAAPPLVRHVTVDAETIAASAIVIPDAARQAATPGRATGSVAEWLVGLVPSNPMAAIVRGDLLQIIVFTLLLGIAITALPARSRRRLVGLFEALAETMMILVGWILIVTPLGVFALAYGFARQMSGDVAGVLIAFAVIVSALLFVFTLLLYPIAIIGGGVSPVAFARAVFPGQIVAVTTRSSLASLPALVIGARTHLRLSETIIGFALPLSASVFKINRTISSTTKLLFLAHIYGVPLSGVEILGFVAASIVLSFSSVGIPGGGSSFKTLPLYLAAGIPIEGVVLLEAIDVIPDIFKTLANTTGYMTVSTVLSRWSGRTAAGAAEPADTRTP